MRTREHRSVAAIAVTHAATGSERPAVLVYLRHKPESATGSGRRHMPSSVIVTAGHAEQTMDVSHTQLHSQYDFLRLMHQNQLAANPVTIVLAIHKPKPSLVTCEDADGVRLARRSPESLVGAAVGKGSSWYLQPNVLPTARLARQ